MEQIKKEINLLQERLQKTKKVRSISKWINAHQKNATKKGQMTGLSQTKKIKNIVKNIFQNKIEQIKNNTNLLQYILAQVTKERDYLKKD